MWAGDNPCPNHFIFLKTTFKIYSLAVGKVDPVPSHFKRQSTIDDGSWMMI